MRRIFWGRSSTRAPRRVAALLVGLGLWWGTALAPVPALAQEPVTTVQLAQTTAAASQPEALTATLAWSPQQTVVGQSVEGVLTLQDDTGQPLTGLASLITLRSAPAIQFLDQPQETEPGVYHFHLTSQDIGEYVIAVALDGVSLALDPWPSVQFSDLEQFNFMTFWRSLLAFFNQLLALMPQLTQWAAV